MLVDYLLDEATRAPELWNQKSYLARSFSLDAGAGILDEGIVPLADFVDTEGPAAVAIAVETDDTGDIHPAVYVRAKGRRRSRRSCRPSPCTISAMPTTAPSWSACCRESRPAR